MFSPLYYVAFEIRGAAKKKRKKRNKRSRYHDHHLIGIEIASPQINHPWWYELMNGSIAQWLKMLWFPPAQNEDTN